MADVTPYYRDVKLLSSSDIAKCGAGHGKVPFRKQTMEPYMHTQCVCVCVCMCVCVCVCVCVCEYIYMQGSLWETNYGANLRWRGVRERGASRGRLSKTKVNVKDVLRSGTVAFASSRV